MAGTNTSQNALPDSMPLAPVVVLVRPQLGENIGMCARAMLNCGVTEMRIVKPRDGWPNPDAIAAASGAVAILENAKIYETTAEALADLRHVFATTARGRDMVKDIFTAEEAAFKIRAAHQAVPDGKPVCGVLFGPERTGLENDDVALADAILNIPLNPGFSSLNLAQAVLLACYSWLSADNPFAPTAVRPDNGGNDAPAAKGDIENLMRQLEEYLSDGRFFRSPDQKPTILRNIRNFFFRAGMTVQETRTMHGIFKNLAGGRKPPE
jgi:tRNA/rRNA methyltransferase